MVVFPRYSHHSNTGRLTNHRETSYALLTFLTLGVGVLLASLTWSARAATECGKTGDPQCTNSYTVNAVVPEARPTQRVVITSPTNGQVFTTNPVTVEGTCPDKMLIKIFTNGIMVGSLLCDRGHFKIPVDLVVGRNDLTALAYNRLDEEGPGSAPVTVTLNVPPGAFGFSSQMLLQSVNYYRGTSTGVEVVWPIEIVGGQAPYAISIDWGDGTTDMITRLTSGPFTMKHTYKKPGTGYLGSFPLIIRGTDAVGRTAYLQLMTIVNDPKGSNIIVPGIPASFNNLLVVWPLWILLVLMIISFWLGERREKHIMDRRMAALA